MHGCHETLQRFFQQAEHFQYQNCYSKPITTISYWKLTIILVMI